VLYEYFILYISKYGTFLASKKLKKKERFVQEQEKAKKRDK
jgi:hypothetical protein